MLPQAAQAGYLVTKVVAVDADSVFGEVRYSIPEETEFGSYVGNVALDLNLDVKELAARRARVVSEGKRQYCDLSLETGFLFVSERIDREELCRKLLKCTLQFQILVENPLKIYSIVVDINDINDNTPAFPENKIRLEISESAAPGKRFPLESAQDPDTGTNTLQTYSLSQNENFILNVNTRAGGGKYPELVLEKALDREAQSDHYLILNAIDGGHPHRSGSVNINIIVLDANDNAPVFSQSVYKAALFENSLNGVLVTSVNATDLDADTNGDITYSFSHISDEAHSGTVYAARSFDYEQIREFQIHIKAQDGGSPPLSSNVTVNIFVQDQNDNAPQVLYPVQTEGSLLAEMVPRSADVGYLVTKLVAVDADSGQNAWLSYKLHKATDRTLFEVGLQNGEIRTLRQVVDKDAVKQRLVVLVEDNGQPSRSATVNVNVAVADSFPEVLSEFSDFTQDKDYNENLTFYLVVSLATVSFLFIVSIIILLSVKFCKWRHPALFYKSTNRNLPVIPSSYYPPRYADVGETGTLRHVYNYEVCLTTDSGKSEFKYIRPCSQSLVNVDPSEAETMPRVLEKNLIQDTDPTTQNEIRLEISELALPGTRFLLESAVDPDVGVNALESYILNPTDHFRLKTSSGSSKYVEMVLQTALDREKQGEHFLVLTAVDGGTPPRSGTVQIRIIVLDANDNAPVFSQAVYKASVLEHSVKGTLVTTVTATDADIGSNKEITYFFTHITDNISEMFELDPDTGEIRIAGQVDFEKQNMYEINIQAKDSGGLTDSSNVIIEIVDVNDNAPVLTLTSFSSPIPEDSLPGTVIALINVQDLDSGKNGQVRCSINQQLPFKIQSSLTNYYTLVTRSILDREMISEYNITITATDEGSPPLCSNQTITLKISDVNDNAPTFNKNLYTTYVMENNSPGLSIFSLQAEDPDWSNNARISYFLEDGQVHGKPVTSYISINSDNGIMYAVRSFDYEQIRDFKCHVIAKDGGSPSLSSNVTVNIFVQDQNDNAPQILYPVQTEGSLVAEMVPRSADVGYLVTKVVAVDADSGQNAWLSYKLHKATDRTFFEVGLQNGEIRTLRQVVDKDAVKQRLVVLVEDNGQPSRSATVNVNVAVADSFPEVLSEFSDLTQDKDYNDNLTFYLVVSLATVSFLFIVSIIVLLSMKLCNWRYSKLFYKSNGNLPVIPTSYYPPRYADAGETGTLQHVYNYEVCLTRDSGKSEFRYIRPCSQSVLSVVSSAAETMPHVQKEKNITEDSDLSMQFLNATLSASVDQRAEDPDEDQNARISFFLIEAQINGTLISSYVSINSHSGILYAARSFDYEQIRLIQIHVKAQDGGSPPLSSNVTVNIFVQDQNDNAPQILYPVQTESSLVAEMVPRSADVGYLVTKVVAVDADSAHNAWLSYKLHKATDRTLFEVGLQNGEIRTLRQVVDKDAVKQRLVVLVEDNGQPSRSATVNVNVAVADSFPELLSDFIDFTQDKDYNENLTFYLVVSLATVSFLFIVSIIILLSVKYCKWRHSSTFYKSNGNLPVIPSSYNPPRYEDAGGTGTLQHVYNYEVCLTTDSGKREFKYIRHCSQSLVNVDPSGTETMPLGQKENNVKEDTDPSIQFCKWRHSRLFYKSSGNLPAIPNSYYPPRYADAGGTGTLQHVYNYEVCLTTDSGKSEFKYIRPCSQSLASVDPSAAETLLHVQKEKNLIESTDPPIQMVYNAFVMENNSPGLSIFSVKTDDADWGQNARISYYLEETSINGTPVSSYISINSDSGILYAVRSFDFEQIREFQIHVKAQDGGSPPLSSNVTVNMFVQDQNDNAPQILYPVQTEGSLVAEMVPRSADVSYLVTKVVAVDADSGQNAWLSYKLHKATDRTLFEVGLQNGEIRTLRQVVDKDAVKQRLVVLVEDNGLPSRSATVNVNVAVADSFPEVLSEFSDFSQDKDYNENLTFYLVVSLATVSFLFIVSIIILSSVKFCKWRQSRLFYKSNGNLPVIQSSYYPPQYADAGGTGTLRHVYNYEVYLTTDSGKSEFKYIRPCSQSLVCVDPSATETMLHEQKENNLIDDTDPSMQVSLNY
ncbi:UNVERIFIED_CONTAM: hypothetical protein FKN15_011275 [Acipenser sinensis]